MTHPLDGPTRALCVEPAHGGGGRRRRALHAANPMRWQSGSGPWYRAFAGVAAAAAAIEAGVGVAAGEPGHLVTALSVLLMAGTWLVCAAWRDRGGGAGPGLLMGASLLVLSGVVATAFPGSPSVVALPAVAFALILPTIGRRTTWAFGLVSVAVAAITAVLTVRAGPTPATDFGQVSSAVAGVVIEGLIVMTILIGQRAELSSLVSRYTSIVEQVPVGLCRVSPDGALLDANDWLVEMLRYPSADALVGVRLGDLLQAGVADPLASSAEPDRVRVEEVVLRRADGTTVAARTRIRAVLSEDGAIGWFQCTVRDITDEREAAARQARLAAAVEQAVEAVVITDPQATILYVNPAFERATGYSPDEVIGRNPRFLQSGLHLPSFYEAMWSELGSGRTWQGEIVNRRRDGSLVTDETTITPLFGAEGELTTYVAVMRDVTAEREAARNQQRIEALLGERQAVADMLSRLVPGGTPVATAERIARATMTLPGIGGAALVAWDADGVAWVMALAGPDTIALKPGERLPQERALYLRARAVAGPWHDSTLTEPFRREYEGTIPRAGILALGYAPIGEGPDLIGVLVAGTNDPDYAVHFGDHLPALVDVATAARLLLADAWHEQRQAGEARAQFAGVIERGAFRPVFQPVVDLASGHAVGFEALTRFEDGLAPDVAFAQARRAGLGLELEAATMRAALAASTQLPPGPWVSLNVSPALIMRGDLLRDILASRSRSVVLEVTEHDVVDDYGALRDAFVELGADLRLAVDDAGAGVANFGHIIELRPDFVKVDRSLIRGVNADLSRQAMVVGLHHFARASNRDVVAEGIETAAELTTLLLLDVRFGQGYLLGRPAEAASWATVTPPAIQALLAGDESREAA